MTGMHLGRERGDILFPEDGYVSGLHCRLHEENGRMFLTDIGSSNGTFVRLAGPRPVPSGSLLLMGQQPKPLLVQIPHYLGGLLSLTMMRIQEFCSLNLGTSLNRLSKQV
jgi:hypothetical protein